MTKKVIIVIVEGSSDEILLIERLKALYKNQHIKFEVQYGDLFYKRKSSEAIKNTIGNMVKKIIQTQKYRPEDILAVIQILDTDGCMIPNDCIKINTHQSISTYYELESIKVDSEKQKNNIIARNQKRTMNIKTMNSVNSVVGKKYNYQLYYFSRTLEQVIFNEANPAKDSKFANIENFIETLSDPVEVFLLDFLPNLTSKTYEDRYKDTWQFISEGTNSLKRSTNIPLLFEYLNQKITEKK